MADERQRPSESSRYLSAIRKIEEAARQDHDLVLSMDEIEALTWNAKRVVKKYWETRNTKRSRQSVQNQLDRPRWKYLDQATEARQLIEEIAEDAVMMIAFHSPENRK